MPLNNNFFFVGIKCDNYPYESYESMWESGGKAPLIHNSALNLGQ
jgi:hypothetical protein